MNYSPFVVHYFHEGAYKRLRYGKRCRENHVWPQYIYQTSFIEPIGRPTMTSVWALVVQMASVLFETSCVIESFMLECTEIFDGINDVSHCFPKMAQVTRKLTSSKVLSIPCSIMFWRVCWNLSHPVNHKLFKEGKLSRLLLFCRRIKIWVQKSWSSMLLPKWTMAWFIVCDAAESITPEDPGWRCDVASDLRLLPWSDKCPELSRSGFGLVDLQL